jgi:hypothetical protein
MSSIPRSILNDAKRLGALHVTQDGRTYRAELPDGKIVKLGKAKRCNRPKIARNRAFA